MTRIFVARAVLRSVNVERHNYLYLSDTTHGWTRHRTKTLDQHRGGGDKPRSLEQQYRSTEAGRRVLVWSKFSNACFRFSLRFGYRRLFPVEFGRFVTSYI